MLHTQRIWRVYPCHSIDEAARYLKQYDPSLLCSAYMVNDLLLLNDSTSEDALMEFAICIAVGQPSLPKTLYIAPYLLTAVQWHVRQVETFTISWYTESDLKADLTAIRPDAPALYGEHDLWLSLHDHPHRCEFCA